MNVAILLGTGYYGEDALHKSPWVCPLSKTHNVFVASRVDDSYSNPKQNRILGDRLYFDLRGAINELQQCASKVASFNQSSYAARKYSKTEILDLQEWLSISFRYVSSFDRRFFDKETLKEKRNVNELDNYFAGLVEFFKDFFSANDVDVFINSLEDDAFSVVAYYTARKLGVSVIGFVGGRFVKRGIMFCDNFSEVLHWTDRDVEWPEIESLYSDSATIAGAKTVSENKAYWSLKALPKRLQGIPLTLACKRYTKTVTNAYPYEKMFFQEFSVLKVLKQYLQGAMRRVLIKRVLQTPNHKEPYFLFPLHYTEDAQVTFAEPVLDQFVLMKLISRALPRPYFLYVKPHPHYLATDINLKKITSASNLENVKIITPESKHIDLIKNSVGVITLNSTTGFEALILGTPVITFGHDFYCKDSLCYVLRDFNGVAPALMQVIAGVQRRDEHVIQEFIKKAYANTVWIDTVHYEHYCYGLTEEDGAKIALALNDVLRRKYDLSQTMP